MIFMINKARLRKRILSHLEACGIDMRSGRSPMSLTKESYRDAHRSKRLEKLEKNLKFLEKKAVVLTSSIANGFEVNPEKIKPIMREVKSGTRDADLFRFACLQWSIPVSEGYGRRQRFVVEDAQNGKLIGIFGLGDAVFNMRARDNYIGWNASNRENRLVNMMDAYIVGAVPPYNRLLGGKLIASMIKSQEIVQSFREKYGARIGLISGVKKDPHLCAVTVTSALGKSSLYNRLRFKDQAIFEHIGSTEGWGHFQFPDEIFRQLSELLEEIDAGESKRYEFGHGPNWKIRTIRRGLATLGMDGDLLRHGYQREIYICRFGDDALQVLCGKKKKPSYKGVKPLTEMVELALGRWVVPRAWRYPDYQMFTRDQFLQSFL